MVALRQRTDQGTTRRRPARRTARHAPARMESMETRLLLSAAVHGNWLQDGALQIDNAGTEMAYATHVLPDGRMLVGGYARGMGNDDFALARLMPDGTPDTSFGNEGLALTDFNNSPDSAYAMAVQTDGRIILAGQTRTSAGYYDFALTRYLPDGTLDTTFGNAGKVVTDVAGSFDQITSVALDAQGRIIVGGVAQVRWNGLFTVARYTSDGVLDTSFGATGIITSGFDTYAAIVYDVVPLADGGVLALGNTTDDSGEAAQWGEYDSDFALMKFDVNGQLVAGFGNGGKVRIDRGHLDEAAQRAVVLEDGRILIAGKTGGDMALLWLRADGSVDTNVADAGLRTIDFAGGNDWASGLRVLPDGSILVTGTAQQEWRDTFAAAHLLADGSLNTAFGDQGRMLFALPGEASVAMNIAATPQGDTLVVGFSYLSERDYDMALVRVQNPTPQQPEPPPVVNQPPVVTLQAPQQGVRLFALSVSAGIVDPDSADTHQVTWDFGDSRTLTLAANDAGALNPTHTYTAAGLYTITLTVTDSAGNAVSQSQQVSVVAAGLAPDPTSPGKKMLLVGGTPGHDTLVVTPHRRNEVQVLINGRLVGVFNPSSRIILEGGDGNDTLAVLGNLRQHAVLQGGRGRDMLLSMSAKSNELIGGDGDDILIGRRHDQFNGGRGRNSIFRL